MSTEGNPLFKNLIQLAHLEAQSNWQESYVDLQDFCFCLSRQCRIFRETLGENAGATLGETLDRLENIVTACEAVMDLFPDDVEGKRAGVVVKSDFIGPSSNIRTACPSTSPGPSRYRQADSGGLRPYKFQPNTAWHDFLSQYFAGTAAPFPSAEINDESCAVASRPREPRLSTDERRFPKTSPSWSSRGGGDLSGENSLSALVDKVNPRDRTGEAAPARQSKLPARHASLRDRRRGPRDRGRKATRSCP